MANADRLWEIVNSQWPKNIEYLTIRQVTNFVPIGSAEVVNRAAYDFAILTMLSTVRRNFVQYEDKAIEEVVNNEVLTTNRNNGIWRQHPDTYVSFSQ